MNYYDIKPCPFCGGKASIKVFYWRETVACERCGALMFPYSGMPMDVLVDAWNHRDASSQERGLKDA